jgi:uncharacterized protein YjbK
MNHNHELEFKTIISEKNYVSLIENYVLTDNIFLQTNHYFDTQELNLSNQSIVLRIRQKGDRFYKLTIKSQQEGNAYESHILLTPEQANEMIEHGFNTKDFFADLDHHVYFVASINNFRASMPYHQGVMYIDRCEYCETIDYELEYEVTEFEEGYKQFLVFLEKHQISKVNTRRKSDRAFSCSINIKK